MLDSSVFYLLLSNHRGQNKSQFYSLGSKTEVEKPESKPDSKVQHQIQKGKGYFRIWAVSKILGSPSDNFLQI